MGRAARRLFLTLIFLNGTLRAAVEMESPAAGADFDFFARERTVVTAGRVLQPLSEVPASIKVFTAEDIERLGARTLADILRLVPGMDVRATNDANWELVRVDNRGLLGSSTVVNKRILFMVDGRPVNFYHYGNFQVDERLPLEHIRQVEIIKGPASSLYGNNAMDGVINLITKSPEDAPGLALGFSGGSFGTWSQEAQYGRLGRDGKPALFLAARGLQTGGPQSLNKNEARYVGNLFAKSTLGRFDVETGWDQSTMQYSGHASQPLNESHVDSRGSFLDVKSRWDVGEAWQFIPRVYVNQNHEFLTWSPYTQIRTDTRNEVSLGADLQANWRINPRHNVVFGSEVRQNEDGHSYFPHMSSTEAALYTQMEGRPWDLLSWTLGGRWDRNSRSPSFSSPRAGVVFHPGPSWTLKSFFGGAFRGPTFAEIHESVPLNGVWLDGNPGLAPERIRSFETVVEFHPRPAFRLQTAFFNNTVKDLMALRPTAASIQSDFPTPAGTYPVLPVYRVLNSGNASIWGVELETEARFFPGVVLWGNYSYLNTENNDISSPARQLSSVQGRLPYAPTSKANGGLEWSLTESFNGGVHAHYVGARRVAFTTLNSLPSFITWDLIGRFRLGADWTLRGGLYNLADLSYQETAGVPMPGRSFQAGVEHRF